jgi:hypothetical protein
MGISFVKSLKRRFFAAPKGTAALFLIQIFATLCYAAPDSGLQNFLEQTLTTVREKEHLPAVAGLVQIGGKIAAEAAIGERALGHPQPVTINDPLAHWLRHKGVYRHHDCSPGRARRDEV